MRKGIMRKLSMLFCFIFLLGSLTACSSNSPSTNEADKETTKDTNVPETADSEKSETKDSAAVSYEALDLSIWAFSGTQTEALELAIAKYQETHPNVNVELVSNTGPNHRQNMIINATSGTMPDMWGMFGGTIGDYYTENDLVYDLTDYAKEHNWDDVFMSDVLDLCRLDGVLAGYPITYTSLEVVYRKDLFEAAGITAVPTNMAEFEEVLAKLKASGVTPFAVGGATQANPMRVVQALIENYAGAEEHDQLMKMEKSWDTESVIKALTKYKEWIDAGYFPDGFLAINQTDIPAMVGSGSCAMFIEGMGAISTLASNGYDLEDYGYFKFPQDDGKRICTYAMMFMISKDVDEAKLQACMDIIELYQSDDVIAALGDSYPFPLPKADSELPAIYDIASNFTEDIASNGVYLIADQALPAAVTSGLYAAMDQVASGDLTPEQTAAQMQKVIEAER